MVSRLAFILFLLSTICWAGFSVLAASEVVCQPATADVPSVGSHKPMPSNGGTSSGKLRLPPPSTPNATTIVPGCPSKVGSDDNKSSGIFKKMNKKKNKVVYAKKYLSSMNTNNKLFGINNITSQQTKLHTYKILRSKLLSSVQPPIFDANLTTIAKTSFNNKSSPETFQTKVTTKSTAAPIVNVKLSTSHSLRKISTSSATTTSAATSVTTAAAATTSTTTMMSTTKRRRRQYRWVYRADTLPNEKDSSHKLFNKSSHNNDTSDRNTTRIHRVDYTKLQHRTAMNDIHKHTSKSKISSSEINFTVNKSIKNRNRFKIFEQRQNDRNERDQQKKGFDGTLSTDDNDIINNYNEVRNEADVINQTYCDQLHDVINHNVRIHHQHSNKSMYNCGMNKHHVTNTNGKMSSKANKGRQTNELGPKFKSAKRQKHKARPMRQNDTKLKLTHITTIDKRRKTDNFFNNKTVSAGNSKNNNTSEQYENSHIRNNNNNNNHNNNNITSNFIFENIRNTSDNNAQKNIEENNKVENHQERNINIVLDDEPSDTSRDDDNNRTHDNDNNQSDNSSANLHAANESSSTVPDQKELVSSNNEIVGSNEIHRHNYETQPNQHNFLHPKFSLNKQLEHDRRKFQRFYKQGMSDQANASMEQLFQNHKPNADYYIRKRPVKKLPPAVHKEQQNDQHFNNTQHRLHSKLFAKHQQLTANSYNSKPTRNNFNSRPQQSFQSQSSTFSNYKHHSPHVERVPQQRLQLKHRANQREQQGQRHFSLQASKTQQSFPLCPVEPPCYCNGKVSMRVNIKCENINEFPRMRTINNFVKVVVMSYLSLKHLPDAAFVHLKVDELDIRGNNLTNNVHTAAFAGVGKNLISLNMAWCNMTKLPAKLFRNMHLLRNLTLAENRLKQLHSLVFKDLTSLERLSLAGNLITEIPVALFEQMKLIRHLDLSYCKLNKLSWNVFNGLRRLETLDLRGNQLRIIEPMTFAELSSLNRLSMGQNPLRRLTSKSFKGLHSLKSLNLAESQLKKIDRDTFRDLKQLDELILSDNKLKLLQVGTLLLSKLQHLALDGNKLTTLPHEISYLPYLRHLDVSYNHIVHIDRCLLVDNAHLETLNLRENPFHCSCSMFWLKETKERLMRRWTDRKKNFPFIPGKCSTPMNVKGISVTNFLDQHCGHVLDEIDDEENRAKFWSMLEPCRGLL